jgi:hypothetical protein
MVSPSLQGSAGNHDPRNLDLNQPSSQKRQPVMLVDFSKAQPDTVLLVMNMVQLLNEFKSFNN